MSSSQRVGLTRSPVAGFPVIGTAMRAFALLQDAERRSWIALVPLAAIAAVLEGVGALLIFGLIGLMSDPEAVSNMRGLGELRALAPNVGDRGFVSAYAVIVAIFFLLKNVFRFVENYAQNRVANNTAVAMSTRILSRYLRAPYSFHLAHDSALLIRNTSDSVNQVTRSVLISATAALSECLVVVGVIAVLIAAAPAATLGACAFGVAATIPLLRAMQSSYAGWGQAVHEMNATILRRLQESFRGIKEIKILAVEPKFVESYRSPRARIASIQRRTDSLRVVPRLAVETFFVISVVAVIVLATRLEVETGRLLTFLGLVAYALMRLLPSLHLVVYHLNNCRFGEAAVDQLHSDWHAGPRLERPGSGPSEQTPAAFHFEDAVRFEGVDYRYPGATDDALQGIDVTIGRGEFIGIVGASGAGKSTLLDLLLGLHAPTRGQIRVDAADLQSVLSRWQSRIGYVSQHAFFIDDTIRRNIALGSDEGEADDPRVWEALRQAALSDFVGGLIDGLDTMIGESGVRLSGGERQRLAIARALYRDPDVLVFDEATSALDGATERAVSDALREAGGDKTLVVVAHRMSTVRRCTRLILLRDGKVADSGTFEELAGRNRGFREIAGLVDDAEVDSLH